MTAHERQQLTALIERQSAAAEQLAQAGHKFDTAVGGMRTALDALTDALAYQLAAMDEIAASQRATVTLLQSVESTHNGGG